MRCENCENVSDWIGDDSDWNRLRDAAAVQRPIYECDICGNRQLIQ